MKQIVENENGLTPEQLEFAKRNFRDLMGACMLALKESDALTEENVKAARELALTATAILLAFKEISKEEAGKEAQA